MGYLCLRDLSGEHEMLRSLLLALVLALTLSIPALAQQSVVVPATTASIPITGTIGAATVIITGVTGQRIYVTSVALVPVATAVVTFTSGTGAGCGSGTSNVTGAMTFAAGQTLMLGIGNGAVWALAPGNSLCITVATAAASGSLSYSQF
jgi:hypothetical protein